MTCDPAPAPLLALRTVTQCTENEWTPCKGSRECTSMLWTQGKFGEVSGIDQTRAEGRLRAMKARCPEWEVAMSSVDFDAG